MLPIWAIIERDLRKYFRSPALILVSLFLPLLQLMIIGYAFGGQIKGVIGRARVARPWRRKRSSFSEKFTAIEARQDLSRAARTDI